MSIKKMFSELCILKSKLFNEYGIEDYGSSIIDGLDKRFHVDDDGILWLDSSGVEYGYDSASKVGSVDGISMFYIRDNGESFYELFSDSLELTYDEYELEIDVEI